MHSRVLSFLLVLLMFLSLCSFSTAQAKKQVLILDIPRFDLAEISTEYPSLQKLANSAGVGLLTTPLSEPLTMDRVFLAFNGGTQVEALPESLMIYNVGEEIKGLKVGDLYHNFTGKPAPVEGAVNIEMAQLGKLNSTIGSHIGLFGKVLHQNNLHTAVIGNSDTDIPNRQAAALVMDENGLIDWADLGKDTLTNDPSFPNGLRTNIDQITLDWNRFHNKADVIVITLGDLERIEQFKTYLSETKYQFYRKQVLANYDHWLKHLFTVIEDNTLVVVFAALPPGKEGSAMLRMAPVMVKRPNSQTGLLFSRSTRKTGLITIYDLPVTVLSFLDVRTNGYNSGYNLEILPGNWWSIPAQRDGFIRNFDLRRPLLTSYGYLLIILVLLVVLSLIFNLSPKILNWLVYGYLFLLTIPVAFLIEAIFNPLYWAGVALCTLGLGGLLFGGAFFIFQRNPFKILFLISTVTVVAIIADGLLNGFFELKSFFGYSAIAGARFYGIGNEYMGFLLGSYIVTISLGFQKLGKYRMQLLWALVCLGAFLLAHPNFGASIGGGITALLCLGVATNLWLERPIRFKNILWLIVSLIPLLGVVVLWEAFVSPRSTTHLSQFITLFKSGSYQTISQIINRKLLLNLRLIASTPLTIALIGILLTAPLIYKRPPMVLIPLIKKYPYIIRGFVGLSISALIALLINDTGVVTAATMCIFGISLLLLVIKNERGVNNYERK